MSRRRLSAEAAREGTKCSRALARGSSAVSSPRMKCPVDRFANDRRLPQERALRTRRASRPCDRRFAPRSGRASSWRCRVSPELKRSRARCRAGSDSPSGLGVRGEEVPRRRRADRRWPPSPSPRRRRCGPGVSGGDDRVARAGSRHGRPTGASGSGSRRREADSPTSATSGSGRVALTHHRAARSGAPGARGSSRGTRRGGRAQAR